MNENEANILRNDLYNVQCNLDIMKRKVNELEAESTKLKSQTAKGGRFEAVVIKKIAEEITTANDEILIIINKAKTEMFDIDLAWNTFYSISQKFSKILKLIKDSNFSA